LLGDAAVEVMDLGARTGLEEVNSDDVNEADDPGARW
jgi:hypothetical protein